MKSFKLCSRLFAAFGLMMMFVVSGWGDGGSNGSCNGEQIGELHAITTTTSRTETGTVSSSDSNDYYYFTPGVAGTLTYSYSSTASTDFYLSKSACDNDRKVNDGTSFGSTNLTVSTSDTIYIRVKRESGSPSYSIPMTFTVTQSPPNMGDIPNQTANVGSPFSLSIASYVTATEGDSISAYTLTGTLPTGLTYNSVTGTISGTPTVTGTFALSAKATDNDGDSNVDTFNIVVSPAITETSGGRDFILRKQENLFGDVKVIGNTVLCLKNGSGQCIESTSGTSNADVDLQKVATSYSTLTIPAGATVKYARLYWQGRQAANSDTTWSSTQKTSAKEIWMKKESGGTWQKYVADFSDFDSTSSTNNVRIYSASALVTDLVTASGVYYIDPSRFYTNTGATNDASTSDGLGSYGAWTLVVVYEDPSSSQARNVSIFDGYKKVVSGNNIDISVSGFLTPKSGVVDSRVQVFTGEGDKYLAKTGDVIQMAGLTFNTTLQTLGTMDSRIDVPGTRSPSLVNNNGIDIQEYQAGTTAGAKNIITTNETGAKFRFTSDQDTYFPSLIVFSTQIYLPELCYDYSVKQDGRYLSIDRNAYPIAQLDDTVSSSPIDVMVYIRNKDADFAAEGMSLKSDINDNRFDLTGNVFTSNTNGSVLNSRGTPAPDTVLCEYDPNGDNSYTNAGCTNGHDIRKGIGSLGHNQYIYTQYQLLPKNIDGIGDINESLGLSLNYYITVDGKQINYPPYVLGSENVKLCPPTTTYMPSWGRFNIVEAGQPNNSIKNNIKTKLSRKPFEMKVVYDSTPTTGDNAAPTANVNSTVMVEIIDVDAFGDVNASCANPHAVNNTIYVPIAMSSANPQISVPVQDVLDHNFAVKNAAYRVWYFVDNNDTLMPWTATGLSNNNKSITGFTGTLYQAASHPLCSSRCSSATKDCVDCMKENYAKPICSRDNFSIRPEAFDIRINDVNQTTKALLNELSNSDTYRYSPEYPPSNLVEKIRMVPGYEYGYAINATGASLGTEATPVLRDAVYAPVPGYTRIFSGANNDYNASMTWSPDVGKITSGCAQISDRPLSFYFKEGQVLNKTDKHDNVGDYRVNIIDKSWTAVDQVTTNSNRTSARAFDTTTDCEQNSNIVAMNLNGEYGCSISSELTNGTFYYKDQNISFHPYDLNIDTFTMTLGSDFNASNPISNLFVSTVDSALATNNTTRWTYMSDLSLSDRMGVRYAGQLKALSYDSKKLSNFVKDCYAEPIDFNGSLVFPNMYQFPTQTRWEYRLQEYNTATGQIWRDTNNTEANSIAPYGLQKNYPYTTIPASSFLKAQNGEIQMQMTVNFDRNSTTAINPLVMRFNDLQVSCTEDKNCSSSVNGVMDYSPDTNLTSNVNVAFVYGRLNTKDVRAFGSVGFDVYAWTEIFGASQFNGRLFSASKGANSLNWFINPFHIDQVHGDSNVTRLQSSVGTVPSSISGGMVAPGVESFRFPAQTNLPISARAHVDIEPWLWFKEADGLAYADPGMNPNGSVDLVVNEADCFSHPCFNVIVMPSIGGTGSAKGGYESTKDNKSSTSTGGWNSVLDYSPALR